MALGEVILKYQLSDGSGSNKLADYLAKAHEKQRWRKSTI